MRSRASLIAAALVALAASVSAQGGGTPATGNPTPGTAQPDPPNLADRVTVVGCLQPVRSPVSSAATETTPSSSRFELAKAERVDRVPPGTGGSPATSVSSTVYRLEGIDSVFSPFVGARVEISGEINTRASAKVPTLLVEFVQRLAAKC